MPSGHSERALTERVERESESLSLHSLFRDSPCGFAASPLYAKGALTAWTLLSAVHLIHRLKHSTFPSVFILLLRYNQEHHSPHACQNKGDPKDRHIDYGERYIIGPQDAADHILHKSQQDRYEDIAGMEIYSSHNDTDDAYLQAA